MANRVGSNLSLRAGAIGNVMTGPANSSHSVSGTHGQSSASAGSKVGKLPGVNDKATEDIDFPPLRATSIQSGSSRAASGLQVLAEPTGDGEEIVILLQEENDETEVDKEDLLPEDIEAALDVAKLESAVIETVPAVLKLGDTDQDNMELADSQAGIELSWADQVDAEMNDDGTRGIKGRSEENKDHTPDRGNQAKKRGGAPPGYQKVDNFQELGVARVFS
ncbi:hypothetical protein R1sor_004892 [Riccia sorocarpa]|uniref:Uncharacterized protein n=1 Tax=Riccia sorocarpa TaxID=122646 RepID=A0ABD3HMB2_9MARC